MNTLNVNSLSRFAWPAFVFAIVLSCITAIATTEVSAADDRSTDLGIEGTQFTLNGKPTFLLGISYYAALSAPEDSIRQDLDDMEHHGFNWLRVWATWNMFDHDVSAVDADGGPREPFLGKLKWLVAECDGRGLVVDVTLTRSSDRIANLEAHQRAVEVIVQALKPHRNWYLDLANERDVRDARYVSPVELKELRELVRRLAPRRLVTASFGGHDLNEQDVRESLLTIGLDFLTPHRPRNAASPAQTEAQTRQCLALTKTIGRPAPVHHQEPFRRGYGRWEPTADAFVTDLQGAIAEGAAGWCFHNGSQRNTADNRPARSFDMRQQRLFDQLDDEERKVVAAVAPSLGSTAIKVP
ncbi:MAG TPA: hypothetical protein VMY37_34655 [Thermoguttaceae bacterium]|nr:hypothetical protein [Thermoguttaceae bacterium]